MAAIAQAVLSGMLVMLAGTLPRNLLFAANLKYGAAIPWAVPLIAIYLWLYWRFLRRTWPEDLRAHRVSPRVWAWSLLAGGLGIAALVLALRIANRLIVLPPQTLPDLGNVPTVTVLSLLLMAAPVAGIVEEAAFRGFMQGPIERRRGLAIAILVTGTMFAVAHLDFTPVLWPYYVAVAAIYGMVTFLTNSILPAVVLHTAGNLYSNLDLWRHGQAEWQAPAGPAARIWTTGIDSAFRISSLAFLVVSGAMLWAYVRLARAARASAAR